MLYELLTNCIPADVIIKTLVKEMLKVMDDTVKPELVYWATYYEHRIQVDDWRHKALHRRLLFVFFPPLLLLLTDARLLTTIATTTALTRSIYA